MEKITREKLFELIKKRNLAFKLFKEEKHARDFYGNGVMHISTFSKMRKSNTPDCDELDGVVLKDLSIQNVILDEKINYYIYNNIYITPEDKYYNHSHIYLNNYIYCLSHSDDRLTKSDIEECIINHGKYIVVFNINELIDKILQTKGESFHILAAAPVRYTTFERSSVFDKSEKYSYEHEYRIVFKEEDEKEESVNIAIENLKNIDIYEVMD